MPSFKSPKYSKIQTQELIMRALGVLQDAGHALTIEEICQGDLALTNQTPQKMSRVLSTLVEHNLVRKTKSKARNNRMIYVATSALEAQGYDISNLVC